MTVSDPVGTDAGFSNIRTTPARGLNGIHIGRQVRFTWYFPVSGVRATVIGELREIHHDIEGVTLHVTGSDNMTGDKHSFELGHETLIEVGL